MVSPRQSRAEITRQSIVEAGVELFGEVGYGDTDMVDVIARAKTTKGACYYYFPTKESLAAAIIEQANARLAGAMAPIWETEAPPMHRLISATFAFIEATETDPIVRIGYQLRQAVRQVSEASTKGFGKTEVVFASAIRRGVADGHVRPDVDADEVAYTVYAALVGVRLLADAFGDNPFERLADAWRTVLRATAPEGELAGLTKVVRAVCRKAQRRG